MVLLNLDRFVLSHCVMCVLCLFLIRRFSNAYFQHHFQCLLLSIVAACCPSREHFLYANIEVIQLLHIERAEQELGLSQVIFTVHFWVAVGSDRQLLRPLPECPWNQTKLIISLSSKGHDLLQKSTTVKRTGVSLRTWYLFFNGLHCDCANVAQLTYLPQIFSPSQEWLWQPHQYRLYKGVENGPLKYGIIPFISLSVGCSFTIYLDPCQLSARAWKTWKVDWMILNSKTFSWNW